MYQIKAAEMKYQRRYCKKTTRLDSFQSISYKNKNYGFPGKHLIWQKIVLYDAVLEQVGKNYLGCCITHEHNEDLTSKGSKFLHIFSVTMTKTGKDNR